MSSANEWSAGEHADGVVLRSLGEGLPLFLFPGMEGSGESCLHLARPAVERALAAGSEPIELVLVDYSREAHTSLEHLADTCLGLVRRHLRRRGADTCLLWGQSFGNLIAATLAAIGEFRVGGCTFVSPFTGLPAWMAHVGSLSMVVTPTPLYRATIGPLGRYVFGPVGDGGRHEFFDGLRAMTSEQVRRRTGWLRGRSFADRFERTAAPARVWLGERDRLVAIDEQSRFFAARARARPDWRLTTIADCGHVLLSSPTIEPTLAELTAWVAECVERAGTLPPREPRPTARRPVQIRRVDLRPAAGGAEVESAPATDDRPLAAGAAPGEAPRP